MEEEEKKVEEKLALRRRESEKECPHEAMVEAQQSLTPKEKEILANKIKRSFYS